MLEQITPVILTYNEAPNIRRCLEKLSWADDIVIVDSFSDDATLEIAHAFPAVRIFQRIFDSHASQWNFALKETGIKTEWVLCLDADYVLTEDFIAEIRKLVPSRDTQGYLSRFIYCIDGKPLRGSLYPPVITLFRHSFGSYWQDGHTHRLSIEGRTEQSHSFILHDDRKSFRRWLASQKIYARLEAVKIAGSRWSALSPADRVRKMRIVAPLVVFFYCLCVKRLMLDGKAGLIYSLQRFLAECTLSAELFKK